VKRHQASSPPPPTKDKRDRERVRINGRTASRQSIARNRRRLGYRQGGCTRFRARGCEGTRRRHGRGRRQGDREADHGHGWRLDFTNCDVSRGSDVEALIAIAVKTWGRLDYAFNNAGIGGKIARVADETEENFDRIIAVNLRGVWLCMKYEILQMMKQGGGAIVNTASAAGLVGSHGMPAYTASKHGVVGLTKTGALEYARANIRINCVCPGVIDTAMVQSFVSTNPRIRERLVAVEPVSRMGKPAEIAEAVAWLLSDAASFVTGCAMPVDGGMTAQ
jgi:NAD(P)-dependent dehydrogenase (short-subunit alcohol dehydrogenase family)